VVDVVRKHCKDQRIEYLPFTLINHKGRIHSTDYFIVNPIGALDCLDKQASTIEYMEDGRIIAVISYVLDPNKLTDAPDLFRIKEWPRKYVISERLASAFTESNFTNIILQEIPQHKP
jgi:hypothetical protein